VRRSLLLAAAIAVGLVLWLASGKLRPPSTEPEVAASAPATAPAPGGAFRVAVRESVARPMRREIVANGRTEAARKVELRAEVKGRVVDVPVPRGTPVAQGDLVVRLDERDRAARLSMAEAMVKQRRIQNDAAQRLSAKGFQAETEALARAAALEEAIALLETARIDLDRTRIEAPFAGTLERRPVEIGDFVEPGDVVATLIELDPLIVVAYLAEANVADVVRGMRGVARTVSGAVVEGRIRYVASEADGATRTFRVELEVANPGARIGAGLSTELRIALDPVPAHQVSAAYLMLDDDGQLGVQTVDDADHVRFRPATIVRADADAVWLAGLPDRLRIVTVGQGFVRSGERVVPVPEPVPAAAAEGAEEAS
jgi:multidrug efflux system membrane fusion protein